MEIRMAAEYNHEAVFEMQASARLFTHTLQQLDKTRKDDVVVAATRGCNLKLAAVMSCNRLQQST